MQIKIEKMKIFEIEQETLIECDNPKCDYNIPNETKDPNVETKQYINMPCPKCGENLLTQKDYDLAASFMRVVNWMNKYFGWLGYFKWRRKKEYSTSVKIKDNKINIVE